MVTLHTVQSVLVCPRCKFLEEVSIKFELNEQLSEMSRSKGDKYSFSIYQVIQFMYIYLEAVKFLTLVTKKQISSRNCHSFKNIYLKYNLLYHCIKYVT